MILSSPHVHTQFCDGRSTAQEQVRSALAHGFQSLGFSSHARQCFHPGACMTPENEQAYIAEIRRLQATYAGQIRIWLGTELDLYACADTAPYDYFIGSVHYLPAKDGFCAVDGDGAALRRFVEAEYAGDGVAMACDYYRSYAALMRCRRPLIGGHFDLVRKNNGQYHLFDESDPRYRAAALDALRAARECGVVLEVNTGGMARYGLASPYPDRWILEAWHGMGGEVILASDCHFAPDIAASYGQAIDLLLDVGYKTVRVLGTGNELLIRTELEGF